jgi:hypothetical protein
MDILIADIKRRMVEHVHAFHPNLYRLPLTDLDRLLQTRIQIE